MNSPSDLAIWIALGCFLASGPALALWLTRPSRRRREALESAYAQTPSGRPDPAPERLPAPPRLPSAFHPRVYTRPPQVSRIQRRIEIEAGRPVPYSQIEWDTDPHTRPYIDPTPTEVGHFEGRGGEFGGGGASGAWESPSSTETASSSDCSAASGAISGSDAGCGGGGSD